MKRCIPALLLFCAGAAQAAGLESSAWQAHWVAAAGAAPYDYGVYHLRRTFDLAAKPARFVVHISADNRYELFVNGARVAVGPARGDLYNWRFETVDIAEHLRAGKNVLAAVVLNYGQYAPVAQITAETGFVLQGDSALESAVNTGPGWKGIRDAAYQPILVTGRDVGGYWAAGAGERVDGAQYPWGWQQTDYDDSAWAPVRVGPGAAGRNASDAPCRWMLVARSVPAMEESPQRIAKLRRASGFTPPESFSARPGAFQVPADTKATFLLDQTYLTTAYPELTVSGGKGSSITLQYAEALWIPGTREKGNRNEIEGKQMKGEYDVFVADGGAKRLFRPLWWRTYRYVEMTVQTHGEPLTIDDLHGVFTAYPFERRASFSGGGAELQTILDTGWRTARLCAHETYMDCPYYEQLQYAGDTRIQALVSLFMTGDGRLMRNAIDLLNSSRTFEGATYSRAPSALEQYIPPFSLWWIGMVHDYWMYQDDPAFVKQMLPGVHAVLSFFAARQKSSGSLGPMPWWNFVDWTKEWHGGTPPATADGSSAPLDLQLLLAYGWAADMENALGSHALAGEYRETESQLRTTVRSLYYDPARKLLADTPGGREFSQHVNALAILGGVARPDEAKDWIERVLDNPSLVQCSIYFRYYLYSAMRQAGDGDRYLDQLGEWRAMLGRGLTTWAEQADPTRSDCHAWGASPNIELFRTVLGVDSAAPGFRRVRIAPHLGKLDHAAGTMPHPRGEILVRLARDGAGLKAEVTLPPGTEGEFIWNGTRKPLREGKQQITF